MEKERLDTLVQRVAGVTRSKAQGLIHTGCVFDTAGEKLDKPGMRLPAGTRLDIRQGPRFVSRGGEKLAAAFDAFPFDAAGHIAMDAGASTGGFTDCLLQHGASHVYSIDVGYGQLAWSLRSDARVIPMDRTNIRHLEPGQLQAAWQAAGRRGSGVPSRFAADCSFISLTLVLPSIARLCAPSSEGVVLIKPQFEAGKADVGKGGVVRDEEVRGRVLETVLEAATEMGFRHLGHIESPVHGPAGNREYLAHLLSPDTGSALDAADA